MFAVLFCFSAGEACIPPPLSPPRAYCTALTRRSPGPVRRPCVVGGVGGGGRWQVQMATGYDARLQQELAQEKQALASALLLLDASKEDLAEQARRAAWGLGLGA